MDLCEGLKDWLFCAQCPYLCSKQCPIESENVIEELRRIMILLDGNGVHRIHYFDQDK